METNKTNMHEQKAEAYRKDEQIYMNDEVKINARGLHKVVFLVFAILLVLLLLIPLIQKLL